MSRLECKSCGDNLRWRHYIGTPENVQSIRCTNPSCSECMLVLAERG